MTHEEGLGSQIARREKKGVEGRMTHEESGSMAG